MSYDRPVMKFCGAACVLFVLVSACTFVGFAAASTLPTDTPVAVRNPLLTLTGPMTPNSSLHITVCGGEGEEVVPYMVGVRLNGWQTSLVRCTYDEDSGCWHATYRIPPGQSGATINVLVLMSDGTIVSQSITVI